MFSVFSFILITIWIFLNLVTFYGYLVAFYSVSVLLEQSSVKFLDVPKLVNNLYFNRFSQPVLNAVR